jgi:hypothetical protein
MSELPYHRYHSDGYVSTYASYRDGGETGTNYLILYYALYRPRLLNSEDRTRLLG